MQIFQRLRSRPGLSTAIGAAFAIIAGLMLLGFASGAFGPQKGGRSVAVSVARRDIPMGAPITPGMLATRDIPADYVVPGAVRKKEDIVGSRALRFIGKGEPVTAASIAGGRGAANMASRIPAGLRAYSIQLSRVAAGCSELRPGDRVDVLATNGDPPVTATLLSGRLVLSLTGGPRGESGDGGLEAQSITLLVCPAEAELLAQAACSGEISVSLCPGETGEHPAGNGG